MFALLTLPRGIPADPEAPLTAADRAGEAPVGIIIRPGPGSGRRAGEAARGARRRTRLTTGILSVPLRLYGRCGSTGVSAPRALD